MKIFVWIQPQRDKGEFFLSDADRFIITALRNKEILTDNITVVSCKKPDKKSFFTNISLDYKLLILNSTSNPINTMYTSLKSELHPDILVMSKTYGKILSKTLGWPSIIIPKGVDILNKILQSQIWQKVGIKIPLSILIEDKHTVQGIDEIPPMQGKETKSLTITEDMEKSILDIIKEEKIYGLQ